MPSVRESAEDAPKELEIVEVRPGVFLRLNAADKAAIAAAAAEPAAEAEEAPASGPVDEPEPVPAEDLAAAAEPAAEAEEAPAKPRSRASKPAAKK